MTLGNRIEQAMKARGMSRKELAEALGISTMAVGNLINDKTEKPRNLLEIAEILGVNASWLKDGADLESSSIATLNGDEAEKKHRIDYLDVRAAAGMVELSNSDYPEIISSLWLSDDGLLELVGKKHSNGIYIINVPTDSMEPTIKKGDVVFIDTNIDHFNGDGIYAFSINGHLYIKRLQKLISGDFKMISDNKIYEPEIMNTEIYQTAKFVGKFIRRWHIESMDL